MSAKKRIVVAPDSFKGSLTAREAALAIKEGIISVMPEAEVVCLPIADGGEGTAECLCDTLEGKWITAMTIDPLGRLIECAYPVVNSSQGLTAIIEVAEASGLTLVSEEERDAMESSSFGTGILIADALRRGCRRILLCLGGSATTDAGQGILEALGWKFGDGVDNSGIIPEVRKTRFEAACDVTNPLYGPDGAAYVFSPQKGASPEEVEILDERLREFAKTTEEYLGKDFSQQAGAGAAGGIGFAVLSYLNGTLSQGIELTLDMLGFDSVVDGADLVITGEGRIDGQTLGGKAPYGVMKRAQSKGVPTIALAGQASDMQALAKAGFLQIRTITPEGMSLSEAMCKEQAKKNLINTIQTTINELY